MRTKKNSSESPDSHHVNAYSDVNDYVTPNGTTHEKYLERKAYSAHHMQKGKRTSKRGSRGGSIHDGPAVGQEIPSENKLLGSENKFEGMLQL